jgi:uncharacterized membrane protein YhhN
MVGDSRRTASVKAVWMILMRKKRPPGRRDVGRFAPRACATMPVRRPGHSRHRPGQQRSNTDGGRMTTYPSDGAPLRTANGSGRVAPWLALTGLAAVAAIAAVYWPLPWLHYLAKPVATLSILAMVWSAAPIEPRYRGGILAGLLLSTAGDVFLMLPGDFFLYGLASFLGAHLAYLFAFVDRERLLAIAWPAGVYGVFAALAVAALLPHVPRTLTLPVIVYALCLATMAAQAAIVWRRRRDRASALAAAGGLFFVASDSLLSIENFITPFVAGPLLVLGTYWIAQCLIGLSAMAFGTESLRRVSSR